MRCADHKRGDPAQEHLRSKPQSKKRGPSKRKSTTRVAFAPEANSFLIELKEEQGLGRDSPTVHGPLPIPRTVCWVSTSTLLYQAEEDGNRGRLRIDVRALPPKPNREGQIQAAARGRRWILGRLQAG